MGRHPGCRGTFDRNNRRAAQTSTPASIAKVYCQAWSGGSSDQGVAVVGFVAASSTSLVGPA
jgi:hypothetical protein